MNRGRGAKRSHPDKLARTRPAHTHLALMGKARETGPGKLVASLPDRLDQGQSGSCTNGALMAAMFTRLKAVGQALPWVPSPRQGYSCTRAIARAAANPVGNLPALEDSGAEGADAISALSYGLTEMKSPTPDGRNYDIWTTDDTGGVGSNVNDEPSVKQAESALSVLNRAHTIDPTAGEIKVFAFARSGAPTAVQLCTDSLDALYPLYVLFYADSRFKQAGANDVLGAPNTSLPGGGHAVFLVDHHANSAGKQEFLLVNSWGTSWANNGMVWVSEEWLTNAWEIWVVDDDLLSEDPQPSS